MTERDIFYAAVEIADPAEQAAYLEKVCAGNTSLRRDVEAMLRVYPELGTFLESAAVDLDNAAAAPVRAGRFQIGLELARGGMGVIYCARDESLGRDVAVKVLHERYSVDSLVGERFLDEARITAQLQHPGIPPVFEVGRLDDSRPYLAMKLIKGRTLEDLLKERAEPTSDRGRYVAVFHQVCQAVAYAHSRHILHRDLKPANVMVGAFGEVQVMDWGLAKLVQPGSKTTEATTGTETVCGTVIQTAREIDSATLAGSMLGTPAFMAPEQAGGELERIDERTDVFGLGAILCVILTGQPPYTAKSGEEARLKAIRGTLAEAHHRLEDCGADAKLLELCRACLSAEPEARPRNAGAVAASVAAYLAGVEERARQAELKRAAAEARATEQRKRRRVQLALAATVAVLFALVGFGLWWQARVEATTAIQMGDLAKSEAKSAADERLARQAAVKSREREAQQRVKAEAAERAAREAGETGRKLLYTTDMRLAPFLWRDDRTTAEQLRLLLARHVPEEGMRDEGRGMSEENGRTSQTEHGPGSSLIPHPSSFRKPDLRGFEWYYYRHLLESSAKVLSGQGVTLTNAALASNGQLATLDKDGQVRRWDPDSGEEDTASRHDLPGGVSAQLRALSPDGRLAAVAEGKKVHLFDASTGKETLQIDSGNGRIRGLLFSRDSARLVIVADNTRWVSTVSGTVVASVDRKSDWVSSLALSADGLTLAFVGHGNHGRQFSIFRLDATANKVTPLAKDVGPHSTLLASALSPDGHWIAVGAKLSGMIFVYDTATGRASAQLASAHASPISAIAFSGDGAKLATADAQGMIKIWADPGKLNSKSTALATLKGHQGSIQSLSFSSDGMRLVSVGSDETARVWDLESAGAAIRRLEGMANVKSLVARFSPDGQWIASADGGSSGVRLWDAATGRLVRELSADDKSSIYSVAFSPTDHRLLAVGHGGQADVSYVALWDIDAGTELARLPGATDLPDFPMDADSRVVGALAFSPDGKYLVAGFGSKDLLSPSSYPNPLKVWDVATLRLIRRLNGHMGYCVSLDFSKDGTMLASGSRDGTAIIWSTQSWKRTQTFQNPDKDSIYEGPGMVEDVAFSPPDGKTLAMASREGNIHLWDVSSGERLKTLKEHSSAVIAVAFSPDGHTMASGSADRTVRLWNVATWRELMQLDSGSIELGRVGTLAFSPEGTQLLAGGSNTTAFWSTVPIVWNDAAGAAARLRRLLHSNADFQSCIRMLSENLRLHEALAKLDANDVRVKAALAAMQANWHASRQAWPDAALAFDRLLAADPTNPHAWLRTPGLFRLATALLYQKRPGDAAKLLQGAAERRVRDATNGGDISTGALFSQLRKAVDERLAKDQLNAGLLALRAELAADESDFARQAADDTVAIRILAKQPADTVSASLRQLYRRRGDAYVGLKQWQKAIDDYARVVTAKTKDEALLSNQALALAEVTLSSAKSVVRKPLDPWQRLAAAYRLKGDQRAIDQLVERRPELAELIADVFTEGKDEERDWRRAISLYSKGITARTTDSALIMKRARAYEALRDWGAAEADWSRAAIGNPEGAKLLAEFARRLAAGGQVPLAKTQFEKARALYERELEADPDNDLVVPELAQLLLDQHDLENPTRWVVLKPTKMSSKGGATLTELGDHSILAGGVSAPAEQYTVAFNVPEGMEIQSIRLEALTHDSLPGHGPGRMTRGNTIGVFALDHWDLTAHGPGRTGSPRRLNFRAASADHSIENFPLGLRGDWNISWEGGKDHTSVWRLLVPITLDAGTELLSHMRFASHPAWPAQNLGRFRLSVSSDPAAFERKQRRFTVMNVTEPWAKLAAAYHMVGDQQALDRVLERHPAAATGIGDLYAAAQDWQRAIAEYHKAITYQPADGGLLTKLASAYESAGRTREAVPYMAKASFMDPRNTLLSISVAARQAWFGQKKEFAATRQRILAFAKGASDATTAERAAKACSILPSTDRAELEAAVALGRTAVKLDGHEYNLLALGMAEYRSGNHVAADEALLAAEEVGPNNRPIRDAAAFYRAMSVFRQGKVAEARQLLGAATAKMKPLPKDAQNPLAGDPYLDDLVVWLAYKEAKAMINFDSAPPVNVGNQKE